MKKIMLEIITCAIFLLLFSTVGSAQKSCDSCKKRAVALEKEVQQQDASIEKMKRYEARNSAKDIRQRKIDALDTPDNVRLANSNVYTRKNSVGKVLPTINCEEIQLKIEYLESKNCCPDRISKLKSIIQSVDKTEE